VVLSQGKDYKVSYKNNEAIGTATIIVKGAKVSASVTFRIVPAAVKATVRSAASGTVTVSGDKARAGQKVSGYQVSYRAKGTSGWTAQTYPAWTLTATLKELQGTTGYMVRVRAWTNVSGKAYYSLWSVAEGTQSTSTRGVAAPRVSTLANNAVWVSDKAEPTQSEEVLAAIRKFIETERQRHRTAIRREVGLAYGLPVTGRARAVRRFRHPGRLGLAT
jgi:hypothetical protein